MQIAAINGYSFVQRKTSFKSAMPVFVQICTDAKTRLPVIDKSTNESFMRKTELMLNDSLKRNVDKIRDSLVDRFRRYFGSRVSDFNGRVVAFTCVDGEFADGKLKPYFYFLTGDTVQSLNNLRMEHKKAVALSGGYRTANLQIAKDNYYKKGKNLVQGAFENFHPNGAGPKALFVTYEPLRKKNGEIKDYRLLDVEFKPLRDYRNPSIELEKQ